MDILIEIVEAIVPALLVAVVMACWNRKQNKRDKAEAKAKEIHTKSESVKLSLLLATAKLSYAVTMAIKRGSPNGEVEDAIEEYDNALDEFREFERKRVSEI